MKVFEKSELIEIDGKYIEKEWAFPDLEGNQTAIMLRWIDNKWELSLWGSAFDGAGTVACGWEPCIEDNAKNILPYVETLMENIEKGA